MKQTKNFKKWRNFWINKKEQDGYQNKLLNAINRYAPPGTEENPEREKRTASRGGVNMNNYEKMFFNGGGKDIQLAGKSLKADSAMVPVDQNAAIANYFYKGTIKNQEETFKADKEGIPIFEKSPEPLKKTYGIKMDDKNPYGGNVEIPTLDSGIKRQIKRERIKYDYNLVSAEKSTVKADDTLDFINKINGVGREAPTSSNHNKFGRKDSLSKKANELKSNRLNDSGFTANTNNMALNIDNFPALPDYEGIQSKFLESQGKSKPLNSSVLDGSSPFKLSKMGGMGARDSTQSIGNGTMNTIKTINTINLERINNKNENRLQDFENKYDIGEGADDVLSNLMRNHGNDISQEAIKLDTHSNFANQNEEYLRSIKEEKWEETLKKRL